MTITLAQGRTVSLQIVFTLKTPQSRQPNSSRNRHHPMMIYDLEPPHDCCSYEIVFRFAADVDLVPSEVSPGYPVPMVLYLHSRQASY